MNKKAIIAPIVVTIIIAIVTIAIVNSVDTMGHKAAQRVNYERNYDENHQTLIDTCEEKKAKWEKGFGMKLPNDCEALVDIVEAKNNIGD